MIRYNYSEYGRIIDVTIHIPINLINFFNNNVEEVVEKLFTTVVKFVKTVYVIDSLI